MTLFLMHPIGDRVWNTMARKRLPRMCRGSKLVFRVCALLVLCALAQAAKANAQSVSTFGLERDTLMGALQGTWKIEAASISYDQANDTYEAEGNVRVSSMDRLIRADWARVDMEKRQAELRGGVVIQFGKNWLKGDHVIWNLDKETGWVDGGTVYFAENQLYAQSRYLAKVGPTQYTLKEGYLTGCDPEQPDWKVRFDEMKVDLEGVAWASHSSFWVRNVPVLYSPLAVLPVEQKRRTGFLIPWGGYSDLSGFDVEVPFYWAMREDMDATFYGRYLEKRGFMSGIEYRISNRTWGEGVWQFNYLHDNADKSFLERKGYPFQTEDRYWLRARHSIELPYEIEGKINLDFVSDRNFLREFTSGSVSFDSSNAVFRDVFGRGILDDYTSLTRESSIYLEKRWESTLLSLDTRYWQQLDTSIDEFTLQRLPALSFVSLPNHIENTPLYYSWQSSVVNYWRKEGDRGGRLDLYPRVYYPMHWQNYLDFEPSLGLRSTSYYVDWQSDSHDQMQSRLFSDVRLDLSTRLNRVYPVDFGDYVAVEHAIRPEVRYVYVPEPIQGELPLFDRLDENQARHQLRYGFSTFLTAKENRRDREGNLATYYRELARLQIFQLFNLEDPPKRDSLFEFGEEQGFTSVGMRLDIMPKRYITLSYDSNLYSDSPNDHRQDFLLTLDSGRGHALILDYQYRKGQPVNELTTQLIMKTLPNLYLSTYHDYSFDQGEMYKQGYGFRYLHGCWSIGVAYERESGDNRVIVSLNLLGLGNVVGSFGTGSGSGARGLP